MLVHGRFEAAPQSTTKLAKSSDMITEELSRRSDRSYAQMKKGPRLRAHGNRVMPPSTLFNLTKFAFALARSPELLAVFSFST